MAQAVTQHFVDAKMPVSSGAKRFMGWPDLVITPLVAFSVWLAALAPTLYLRKQFTLGLFECTVIYYLSMVMLTFCVLKVIRTLFAPYFTASTFSVNRNRKRAYIAFNLYGFLLI